MKIEEITVLYYDADGNECSKTFTDGLIPTTVSGMKHCKEYDMVMSNIKEGDNIVLMFEPYNKFDPNAIACYWKGIRIGYIPKKDIPLIMKQIALEKCTCEATVKKILDVSVALIVPYNNLGQERQLIGARAPKLRPMTEEQKKESDIFYDNSKDDESKSLIRTLNIRIPYTTNSADAFEKMRNLQGQANKCEYIGYIDSNDKPLLYSKEIGIPVYVEDEEIANYILSNKELFSFISNVIINREENYIELWFVITVILYNHKYITPEYKEENKNINERVVLKDVTLPSTYENLEFVQTVLDYKLKYYEDAIFLASKVGSTAMLFNNDLGILKPIYDKDLKEKVLGGEQFLVTVDMNDSDVSELIRLKVTMIKYP